MFASFLVYSGLLVMLAGVVSVLRPLPLLRIRSRRGGAAVAAAGLLLAGIGFALPAPEHRVADRASKLDEFMPVWQFDERHQTHVDAPPTRAYEAIRAVRANEILLFRTLTAMRRFGRPGPESILNAPETKPILDVATSSGFVYLAQIAPREIVVGTVVGVPAGWRGRGRLTPEVFQKPLPPGFVLATMNFAIAPEAGGSRVTTETRVFANSDSSRRAFSIYWRIIYPGSAIIRRMWLRAIERRAESEIGRKVHRETERSGDRKEGSLVFSVSRWLS